jgi:hypothetical protein
VPAVCFCFPFSTFLVFISALPRCLMLLPELTCPSPFDVEFHYVQRTHTFQGFSQHPVHVLHHPCLILLQTRVLCCHVVSPHHSRHPMNNNMPLHPWVFAIGSQSSALKLSSASTFRSHYSAVHWVADTTIPTSAG